MIAALRVLVLAALIVVGGAAGDAHAQPEAPAAAAPTGAPPVRVVPAGPRQMPPMLGVPDRAAPGAAAPATGEAPKAAPASVSTPHSDRTTGTSKPLALAFWLFAALCIGGAVFVITRANLITAVMGMVGTFLAIAAVYMMLFATFLAAVQVLVYAGAIMVLFVFVIMILNRPEDEPFSASGRLGKGLAIAGLGYLLLRLVMMLWKVTPPPQALDAPASVNIGVAGKAAMVDWGSTQAVGKELFTTYLFPFEAVSILLLVAVVGAIAIARPLAAGEGEPEGKA